MSLLEDIARLNEGLTPEDLLKLDEKRGIAEQSERWQRINTAQPSHSGELAGGPRMSGKGSWYSQLPQYGWVDREDKPGSNALGVPDDEQGIALPSRKTLGQWFDVTFPNGETHRLQQTDVGPAKWTGRGIDISAAAAHKAGFNPNNFPTNGGFTWSPAEGPQTYDTEDRTAAGIGLTRNQNEATAFDPTGQKRMANGDGSQGILPYLGMQNQQPQGLLGALGDPETMAYIGMMLKGFNPYSQIDPNSMLSSAHTNALRRQQLMQQEAERATDNRRADEALGLRRQEYGDARTERQQREAERIGLKREELERKERERKANAEALRVLGVPTATPSSPDDTETPPGPQSSLPDAYAPPPVSPATAMASATPQFTDLPTDPMDEGAAAGPAGQTGQTAPNRDDVLKERVKNLTEAYQREGLSPNTRKLIADEIKATNDKIGVPEGMDPKEYKKLKTKSEFSKTERAGEQAVESSIIIDEINRASKLVTPGAPTTMIGKAARDIGIDTSPPTTGLVGEYAQYIGGTPARALQGHLRTIASHVTFDTLQKMREASPTGAALGPVSDFENKLLGSLKGSLDQGSRPADLQYNLNRLRNYTHAIASGMKVTPQNAQEVLSGVSIKREAIEAIGSGKNKEQVLRRLKEYGIDTRGLE